jgi:membrane-bound lytic murein transglycosylase D
LTLRLGAQYYPPIAAPTDVVTEGERVLSRGTAAVLAMLLAACSAIPEKPAQEVAPPSVAPPAVARAEAPPLEPAPPPTAVPAYTPEPPAITIARPAAARAQVARPAGDQIITDLVGELDAESSDLWARIRRGWAVPDLVDDPLVRKWEIWYSERPDYVARMIDRSRRYLYHVVIEVEERGMPLEIALLPMIESAFNPMAYSRAKASGIWQFVPATGRNFGLDQNWWVDSRRDVVKATHGALDYLGKLHGMFGDWQLALAAYNWGEGSVSRAQVANRRKGLPEDYPSLKMPDETRNYLPKLQAVKNIVRDPAAFGLKLADIPNFPYFKAVSVDRKMDVKRAAELAEMSVEDFVSLNPQHNRPVIAGADEFTILLPYDRADLFIGKLHLHDQPLVSWQAYRLKQGETIGQVADRFDVSVESLRAVNGVAPRSRVPAGHTLLVPVRSPGVDAAATLQHAVFRPVPPTRTTVHVVRKGETLQAIAARLHVSAAELREWNGLRSDRVATGQRLRILGDEGAGAPAPVVRVKGAPVAATRSGATRTGTATAPAASAKSSAAKSGAAPKAGAVQTPPRASSASGRQSQAGARRSVASN